jgi:hypothetical protein
MAIRSSMATSGGVARLSPPALGGDHVHADLCRGSPGRGLAVLNRQGHDWSAARRSYSQSAGGGREWPRVHRAADQSPTGPACARTTFAWRSAGPRPTVSCATSCTRGGRAPIRATATSGYTSRRRVWPPRSAGGGLEECSRGRLVSGRRGAATSECDPTASFSVFRTLGAPRGTAASGSGGKSRHGARAGSRGRARRFAACVR